jgi:hypothetical protein
MLRVLSGSRLLGVVRTSLGFRRLACETKRRNASGSARALRKQAGSGLDTAVELALDFLRTIKPLKMLHINMAQPDMVEKKLLL